MSNHYKHYSRLRVPGPRWLFCSLLLLLFVSPACAMSVSVDPSSKGQPTEWSGTLKATFVGQDGRNYAGKLCSSGTKNDNVHIHLSGIRTDNDPVAFRVEDRAQGGLWATPCDPVSNWFLYVEPVVNGETDIYFKPFRDAPAGTEYTITVSYNDGAKQMVVVEGLLVEP